MNTKFFFTLPVVAMFAMTMTTTVANAAVRKAEVNKVVRVEAVSINNVDAKVVAKFTPIFGNDVDAQVDTKPAKRVGGGYDATLAKKGWLDSKANTKLAMPVKKRLPGVRY